MQIGTLILCGFLWRINLFPSSHKSPKIGTAPGEANAPVPSVIPPAPYILFIGIIAIPFSPLLLRYILLGDSTAASQHLLVHSNLAGILTAFRRLTFSHSDSYLSSYFFSFNKDI